MNRFVSVVKDTIDDDILAMQARKTSDIDMAMAAKNRPGKMTIQELVRLFGPMDFSEDGEGGTYTDPFILVDRESSRSADELLILSSTILRFTNHDSRLADHENRNRKQKKRFKI